MDIEWYNKIMDSEAEGVIKAVEDYVQLMGRQNKRLRQQVAELQSEEAYKALVNTNQELRQQQTHYINYGLSQEQVEYGQQLFKEHLKQEHPDALEEMNRIPYHYEICLDGGGIFSNGKYLVCEKCGCKLEINKDERE